MIRRRSNLLVAGALAACGAGGTAVESPSPAAQLIDIAAARFTAGDPVGVKGGRADEAPRSVSIEAFQIMRTEVTNDQFAAFVTATGHVTDVERRGRGFVWDGRWREVDGVSWRAPRGTPIAGRGSHPVTQVSARDAAAFCVHHGLRLPTEDEWELAARGPTSRRYPWGDQDPVQRGPRRANFGTVACCAADDSDGYQTTAPVGSFPRGATPEGLLDMAGNVWEWTASAFPGRPDRVSLRGGGWGNNPFCLRAAYRHANPPDVGLDHVGFRCAR